MNSLINLFEDILSLEYTELKDEDKGKAQEAAVKKRIAAAGIPQIKKGRLSKRHKELLREGRADLSFFKKGLPPTDWFIEQPLGANDKPDFLIYYGGYFFYVECKTGGASPKPTWNTSLPQEWIIYVFTEKKSNRTTVFMGTVLSPEVRKLFYDHPFAVQMRDMAEQLNVVIKDHPQNDAGWGFYLRNMFNQAGDKEIINWCIKPGRESREAEVLEFIKENSEVENQEAPVYTQYGAVYEIDTPIYISQKEKIKEHGIGVVTQSVPPQGSTPGKIKVQLNGSELTLRQGVIISEDDQQRLFQ